MGAIQSCWPRPQAVPIGGMWSSRPDACFYRITFRDSLMVGRRDTGHRGQGDVRHGSLFKDMHKNPNEHVATCMGPNPHPKRMLLCPAFLHVGPKKHAGVVRAPAAVAVAQWMARQLPWPGISWLEGAMDDDAARCAVGRKASPAAQSVCLELPQRGPGSFAVCHHRAPTVPAGSNSPQLMGTAAVCSLGCI